MSMCLPCNVYAKWQHSLLQAHEQLQQGSKSNWTGTNAKPPSSPKAEDERRVHGRGSHSNPTLAQFLIADTNDPMEEHKRCQVLLDAPAPELAPTSTPGTLASNLQYAS